MSKPGNVHAFFAKLAAAVGTTEERPSLKMLHRAAVAQETNMTESLQDVLLRDQTLPKFFALELKDYGVGLPPLAHC